MNGKKARNEWKKDGTEWYYLGKNGYLVMNQIISNPEGDRYVGSTGALLKNCTVDLKGHAYQSDSRGIMTPIEK